MVIIKKSEVDFECPLRFFTLYICSAFGYNSVINISEHVFGNTPEVSMKNERNGRILR